jgi:hypothetical protein
MRSPVKAFIKVDLPKINIQTLEMRATRTAVWTSNDSNVSDTTEVLLDDLMGLSRSESSSGFVERNFLSLHMDCILLKGISSLDCSDDFSGQLF